MKHQLLKLVMNNLFLYAKGNFEEDATALIVNALSRSKNLPLEFAEAKKLLELSLEGAVG